jgi:hypothetical protein
MKRKKTIKLILCDYCKDSGIDVLNPSQPCPFCSDNQPRGSDYSEKFLSCSIEDLERKYLENFNQETN